ncbi:MAG TPA: BamA/TamA family outer membrane protein [Terriglobia bacterium]|nr:BamA/TamA family outer membrane protein [Terriglobia bacterium]
MFCFRLFAKPFVLPGVLALTILFPANLPAQYFGKNKTRYETLDFKVLKTPHFNIYYYGEESAIAPVVGQMAERWRTRIGRVMDFELPEEQPIILYASEAAFRSTTILPDEIGESTGGVTESSRRRVILPVAGPLAETDHVLGHELVHAFQFAMTAHSGAPGSAGLPTWFVEGMAEYLSLGADHPLTAMWMRDSVKRSDVPTLDQLDDPRYFPYRFAQAFWAFVGGEFGDDSIGRLLRSASDEGINAGIEKTLGINAGELVRQWHDALLRAYAPVLFRRADIDEPHDAKAVITAMVDEGRLHIGPVLSPDGSTMALFSQKDHSSIDLFLADARTGQLTRKITQTEADPHMEGLQFIESAGAWSADGQRFAFSAISAGRPEVAIYNVNENRIERKHRFPALGKITTLTWSPDGHSIALSALYHGTMDLFVFDVETGALQQWTNDLLADLDPAWSPDGKSVVFVTDRFTSDLDTLRFGPYRLARLDVATGDIEPLDTFPDGVSVNPEWSPDGSSVYFVSDRDGIPDLYRLSMTDHRINQLTQLRTGVSGITRLSPSFSVASRSGALVYTAFEERSYSIYRLDSPESLTGLPAKAPDTSLVTSALPPPETSRLVTSYLASPLDGLISADDFSVGPYHSGLHLDHIAPVAVSVGIGDFSTGVSGGTQLEWSDLLGRHHLTATIQTFVTSSSGGGFVNNFAGIGEYTNQKSRWDWGFVGGQIPYESGQFLRTIVDTDSGPLLVDQSALVWQRDREVAGVLAYPFNRARRVEFSLGYRNTSFDARARTRIFDLISGSLLVEDTSDLPTPDSLNMGTASAALVYDTSISGGVSPAGGERHRIELSAARGSLDYFTFLGDYRRYLNLPGPFVLAGRALHIGRYGGDSQDTRLQDFFLGNAYFVRGYDANSFTADECGATLVPGACPVFDRLIGNRLAVANAELRIPLFGAQGVVHSPGVPPVEVAGFYDAGIAWTRAEKATFLGGDRTPVTSAGATLRFNMLGLAIGELNFVHPNDRPAKRWVWQFDFKAGF